MSVVFALTVLMVTGLIESRYVCERPLDILLAIDGSASICNGVVESCSNWLSILQFNKDFVSRFRIGSHDSRVACLTTSDNLHKEWNLNAYKDIESLSSAIDNVELPGGEFNDALSTTKLFTEIFNPLAGDRLLVQNVIMMVTDGSKNFDPNVASIMATVYQQTRIAGFVVCIQPECKEEMARGKSSPPRKENETYFMVDYQSLDNAVDNVVEKICSYKMGLIAI